MSGAETAYPVDRNFVWVYDTREDKVTKRFSVPHIQYASNIAMHPDTGKLAVGLNTGDVALINLKAQRETLLLPGKGVWATSLKFSTDGKQLIGGLPNGHLIFWEVPAPTL